MAFKIDFSLANVFIQHFSGVSKGLLKLWSRYLYRSLNMWGQMSKNKMGFGFAHLEKSFPSLGIFKVKNWS